MRRRRYAAFALGNKQYQHFGAMGIWVDKTCARWGATCLHPLAIGDDDDDLEGDFETWREGLWKALCPAGEGADSATGAEASAPLAPTAQFGATWLDGAVASAPATALDFLQASLPKYALHECTLAANRELCAQPQYGSVKHVELRVGTEASGKPGLSYHTADDLAVCCDNGTSRAAAFARRLGLQPAASFELSALDKGAGASAPLPTPCSVEQVSSPRDCFWLLLVASDCF